MVSEYSPFTPGQPVSPELFVGRSAEVERLAGYAADAANDRFQVAFLSGERGYWIRVRCAKRTQVLRREGLYSSHLTTWRKAALRPCRRNAAASRSEIRWMRRYGIDVQGKVAGLLGISLDDDLLWNTATTCSRFMCS